ncbi:hypothetical protein V2J09_013221, partial [Rumex salicifolius]
GLKTKEEAIGVEQGRANKQPTFCPLVEGHIFKKNMFEPHRKANKPPPTDTITHKLPPNSPDLCEGRSVSSQHQFKRNPGIDVIHILKNK